MNKDAISKLIDSNGYSADAIPELEKYVEHQITSNEYDFEANHALLKLYQFHPSKSNKKFVAQILIKALAQTPASDFMLHLYVIPESVVRYKKNQEFFMNIKSQDHSMTTTKAQIPIF